MNLNEFILQEDVIDKMNELLEQALPEIKKFVVENFDYFVEDNVEDIAKNIAIFVEVATRSLLSNIAVGLYEEALQAIEEAEQEVSRYL